MNLLNRWKVVCMCVLCLSVHLWIYFFFSLHFCVNVLVHLHAHVVIFQYLWPFWLGSIWKHQSCFQDESLPHYCQTWWLVSQTLGVWQREANFVIFFLSLCRPDHNIAVCDCFWASLGKFTVGRCTLTMMLWLVRVVWNCVVFSSTKIDMWLIIYLQKKKRKSNLIPKLSCQYFILIQHMELWQQLWLIVWHLVLLHCWLPHNEACLECPTFLLPFSCSWWAFFQDFTHPKTFVFFKHPPKLTGLGSMDSSSLFHHAIFFAQLVCVLYCSRNTVILSIHGLYVFYFTLCIKIS